MNDLKDHDLIKISHIEKIKINCGKNKEIRSKLEESIKHNSCLAKIQIIV